MGQESSEQSVSHDIGHETAAGRVSTRTGLNDHLKRPLPPSRTTSYSKRHASFDSPREVPLPSPSSQLSSYFPSFSTTSSHAHTSSLGSQGRGTESNSTLTTDDYPVFDLHSQDGSESGDDSLPSAPSSPNSSPSSAAQLPPPVNKTDMVHKYMTSVDEMEEMEILPRSNGEGTPNPRDRSSSPGAVRPRPQPTHSGPSQSSSSVGPVFPWSRPYSLPQNHSNSFGQNSTMPTPMQTKPHWPARSSSASLPLPMQTPYFTLPETSDLSMAAPLNEDTETEAESLHIRLPPAPSQPSSSNVKQSFSPFTPRYPAPTPAPTSSATAMLASVQPSTTSPIQRSISAASANAYPAPAAPVILTPPPPTTSSSRPHAPYEPFLCHNPVSEDRHSISVETLNREYRLLVGLPGFSRDAITLATRRRRILHIVADSWAPGGGHFERRVSFGYDADLTQVRAEFDGNILKIIVPRRVNPATTY